MARYIDADRFKRNLENAMEKMHVINGVHAVGLEAVIESLNRQPNADVVPKTEVVREILSDLKKQIHDRAIYPHNSGINSYVTLKVVDAVIEEVRKKNAPDCRDCKYFVGCECFGEPCCDLTKKENK